MLIVGGGPAGAAAAVYAARKGIRTGMLAERMGGQTMDTMSIENFISVLETDGPKFAAALEQHAKQYDVDILNLQRAVSRLLEGSGIALSFIDCEGQPICNEGLRRDELVLRLVSGEHPTDPTTCSA